jgi:hypothetical protein
MGKIEKKYTLADLESVSAVTAEFFGDRIKVNRFYDAEYTDSGIVGVWQYVRDAALTLEREAAKFGVAGEDYDWLLVVQDFALRLYKYEHSQQRIAEVAREVLKDNKYKEQEN